MPKASSFEELEALIGYHFKDPALILQALTHSSFTNEQKINKTGNYERLEFLGDAVLELTASDFLFHQIPQIPEGEMTKMRAACVCEQALALCAKELELERFIRVGKGEEQSGGRRRDSITADVMEAVIGALYLDGGMEVSKTFIERFILSDLENRQMVKDSKSLLQELVQGRFHTNVTYEVVGTRGPEHEKEFVVQTSIDGQAVSLGQGRSKKAAQQQAAYKALLKLKKYKEA